MKKAKILFLYILGFGLIFIGSNYTSVEKEIVHKGINKKMAKIHVPFIANQGQVDEKVTYYAKTFGGTVFVTEDGEIVYSLPKLDEEKAVSFKEIFVGGKAKDIKGEEESRTNVNYFIGNDKSNWKRNIPTYEYVNLGEVYEGIELKLKAYGKNVEKLFYVKPGASPEKIKVKVNEDIKINKQGELAVETALGDVKFTKPIAYQIQNQKKEYVEVAYAIEDDKYGFKVGNYDKSNELIIDPLIASTFLGSAGMDIFSAIKLDSSGNVYITGKTQSSGFPVDGYDEVYNSAECVVSKLSSDLSTLSASTFFGGTGADNCYDVTVDGSGNVYVVGDTYSSDFPTTAGVFEDTYESGTLFLSKFDSTLDNLLASTFIVAVSYTSDFTLLIDSSGNVILAGTVQASDYPTTAGVYNEDYSALRDVFISKFDNVLENLLASTYIGGSGNDELRGAVLDSSDNVYITGRTYDHATTDYPVTVGAYDTIFNGDWDIYVSKVSSDLVNLTASTYIGTSNDDDMGRGIALDSSNNIYIVGEAKQGYPATVGAYDTACNCCSYDVVVSKFDNDLENLLASTFLGSNNDSGSNETGLSIVIDSADNVYIAGAAQDANFPTTSGAYDTSYSDSNDVFIAKFSSDLTTLSASTFVGDSGGEAGTDLELNSSSQLIVSGNTTSTSYPTTSGAYDEVFNGGTSYGDFFVSKFASCLSTPNITASAISGNTTEAGGTATFTVSLNCKPTDDVTIGVSSSDTTEGTVSTASLVFTTVNWATAQTVTVTGANDDLDDGDILFSIDLAAATSNDSDYDGIDLDNINVTNTDDETAGFTISSISGDTIEDGTQATFTVKLTSEPTDDVAIGVSSSDEGEGTVSASSLTFTSVNWNGNQTITVTGVDDDLDDGNIAYSIVLAAATSDDTDYDGLNPADVSVTNTDNDSAGFTISSISGNTVEDGTQATFTVKLTSEPTDDVVIGVSSSDEGEGTVSASSLTFTSVNWNGNQTITVTGVDDDLDDGNIAYSIVLAAATSDDSDYDGLNPADVSVTNTDNDSAGFTISSISGNTVEDGTQATFTVKLTSEPTDDVIIGVSSSDEGEGTVSTSSLTFTSANWNGNQTITVTGVDDDSIDGNQVFNIVLAAATSDDSDYSGLNPSDVSATNIDSDTAGFTISSISGSTVEDGTQATFTVKLTSEPTDDVIIGVSSSDEGEGTVSASSLTFTSANWNGNQTITVTGVDDDSIDGNQGFNIVLAAATSDDTDYDGLNPADVSVTNTDNDSAGFTISSISGNTVEDGTQATFTVKLTSEPTDDVVIGVSSSDEGEGTVSASSLTFTSANWNGNQTITVTGVDDDLDDGNIAYSIVLAAATSDDSDYDGLDPSDVSVTNTDDDTAGFTIGSISGSTVEDGTQATFTVKLTSEPTDDVIIGVSSSDEGEGTVSASSLTFTSANWNGNQTITVTGVDDDSIDGNQGFNIVLAAATSDDSDYSGLDPSDVSVTNTDNDTAGFTISSISGSTVEDGTQATFTVKLTSEPTDDVIIGVSSSDEGEGTVSTASLTFTSVNWNGNQTVTVTGINDDVADGNQVFNIVLAAVSSSDGNYDNLDPSDISVTNTDNDSAGFTISSISGNTVEDGTQATFTVKLTSEPTDDVIIGVSSSDSEEGTVSPSSLTFTDSNWNANQTVTVTGVDDDVADGNQGLNIVLAAASSDDSNYDSLDPSDVSVTNTDNDSAGFTISSISGNTVEDGTQATFTVKLTSEPTDDVIIGVSSSDSEEGTVSPSSLTFTDSNWNANQIVTVTGVNEDVADGNQDFNIVLAAASSDDSNYDSLDPSDVSVTNIDDDSPGFIISSISGDTTEEEDQATFTVRLTTQPTDDVIIGVSSSDEDEGTASPSSLTFTDSNWNANQTATVTGVDDDVADGNQGFNIVLAAASSADDDYNNLNPDDVSVTNTDDDTAGFIISAISGDTSEEEEVAYFMVRLSSEPTEDVIISLSSLDEEEGIIEPISLTFTSENWNQEEPVTVIGVDDSLADGNQNFMIALAAAVSNDGNYNGLDPSDVSVTNIDDDSPGFIISEISGNTSEEGGTATFTVRLACEPLADVTIILSSSDATEGSISVSSLTFTSENWSANQTVTVTGMPDTIDDGDQIYTIIAAPAISDDSDYDSLDPEDVTVVNIDAPEILVIADELPPTLGDIEITEAVAEEEVDQDSDSNEAGSGLQGAGCGIVATNRDISSFILLGLFVLMGLIGLRRKQ